jgi:hypothetical protein
MCGRTVLSEGLRLQEESPGMSLGIGGWLSVVSVGRRFRVSLPALPRHGHAHACLTARPLPSASALQGAAHGLLRVRAAAASCNCLVWRRGGHPGLRGQLRRGGLRQVNLEGRGRPVGVDGGLHGGFTWRLWAIVVGGGGRGGGSLVGVPAAWRRSALSGTCFRCSVVDTLRLECNDGTLVLGR